MAGFQAFADYIVCEQPIRNVVVNNESIGYDFQIKYPSYRGTYLSCIEKLEIEVDGAKIDNQHLRFALNGKEFLIEELPALFKEYWFVHNNATIRVFCDGGLPEGSTHSIHVFISHRIPYTGYFGDYLVLDSANTKVLMVSDLGGAL